MQRRKFIKNAGVIAASVISTPYILPSGRLFAATGSQVASHVVFVLFAGGVRQQETVLQRYLDDSQGINIPGNILYNIFEGAPPTSKIVYGTDGALQGDTPIPKLLSQTFEKQGTIFMEARSATAGHYGGLNGLVQGTTLASQGLKRKPINPTIFEYTRKHLGLKATETWFVGNTIGNSIPLLNYSVHEDYGVKYGANFLAPNTIFGSDGQKHLLNAKVYDPTNELEPMYKVKAFTDNVWGTMSSGLTTIENTEEEKNDIKNFIRATFNKKQAGTLAKPPVADNGDAITVGYACEVMKWFKPKLTVVNMHAPDVCHSNFTNYLRAIHRSDHSLAYLWNYIQTQIPEMANNTVLIAIPECGRNLQPNAIQDQNDWFCYDHSDQNARRIFSLIAGPGVPANHKVGNENNPIGTSMDGILTIGEVLGFKNDIPKAYLSSSAKSMFDLM